MKKFAKLLFCALLFAEALSAQELIFKSFERRERDLEAKIRPRHDNAGDPCALVRVCLVLDDPTIRGNMGNVGEVVKRRESEYGVYLPVSTTEIRINHKDVLPFVYRLNEKLEPYGTYELYCLRSSRVVEVLTEGPATDRSLNEEERLAEELDYLKEAPYLVADAMPKFQGGDLADFQAWANKNLQYPQLAVENHISGRVVASFVVEKDGSVGDVEVLISPDRVLSGEVIRLLGSSPLWTPGENQGEAVRVKQTIPITFQLLNNRQNNIEVYKVGDYYRKGSAEGIVFEVDSTGRHGKIVSLKEEKVQWGTYDKFFGMLSTSDGAINMSKIRSVKDELVEYSNGRGIIRYDWSDGFPIFRFSSLLGSNWYIPAVEELVAISRVKAKINLTIERIAAERGEDPVYIKNQYYWSSTEYDGSNAYLVLMGKGWAGSYFGKSNWDYVRAVRTF